jgi:N-acetylmuramic acid 6-phosphate etherase
MATGVTSERATQTLELAHGSAKIAITMLLAGINADKAKARLTACSGLVAKAIISEE